MKIGIIDADLIGRNKHRFPNLVSMKLAGYYKELGNDVELLLSYDNLEKYDKVFISKVFTDTPVDEDILNMDNVEYGGTGFFYDKAIPLPYEIEHHMPYYDLYKDWVDEMLSKGAKKREFEGYLNCSIGFMTRGCFRQCQFCVNRNYKKSVRHSSVYEFLDVNRKRIWLLDDNVFACSEWREIFEELNSTNKKFSFRQGMDERLLTKEKCEVLLNSNHINDYIFAFDNIEDREVIERKLKIWHEVSKDYNVHIVMFYVFCGYDREDKYDEEFWIKDIVDVFRRAKILMKYGCVPYIMRHKNYVNSPYRGSYVTLARWCNQPCFFKKKSYKEFCLADQSSKKTDTLCASMRYMLEFKEVYPEIEEYYNMKFEELRYKFDEGEDVDE